MSHPIALALAFAILASGCEAQEAGVEARARMVEDQLVARDIADPAVLRAMQRVPRHEFVPAVERPFAYGDRPLPIGYGQTISQPYIVALMTQLAELAPDDRVLEIGTGSGYQAAVLAEIVGRVWSVERLPELAESARARLDRLGYRNVRIRSGDGYEGWAAHAPFDAILVTAAPERIPPALVDQLAPGGVMIVPVGRAGAVQSLRRVRRGADGEVRAEDLLPVRFVPMVPGRSDGLRPRR